MNNYWDAPYRWNGVMQSPGAGGSVAADNMLNVGPQGIPAVTAPAAPQAKPNNGGGAFWKILGTIGDGLAVAGGAKPVYMPAMLDLQEKVNEERKTQAALAARQSALSNSGLSQNQQSLVMNGLAKVTDFGPAKEDALSAHIRLAGYDPSSPEGQQIARGILAREASGQGNLVGSPETGYRWMYPPSQPLPWDRPSPSADAIAMLKAHPETADQFKSKFGIDPQQYLGGPTQPASGGFR